jgi:hypothetical protein
MSQVRNIAFEIEVKPKNSPVRNLPIKKKLEQSLHTESAPPTMEDIEQKLKKAEEFRREELSKRIFSSDEKLTKALMRKNLIEAKEKKEVERLAQELESKLEKGEQLRTQLIDQRLQFTKKTSDNLSKA